MTYVGGALPVGLAQKAVENMLGIVGLVLAIMIITLIKSAWDGKLRDIINAQSPKAVGEKIEELGSEVSETKDMVEETQDDVCSLQEEVSEVRTDVETTKRTVYEMHRVMADGQATVDERTLRDVLDLEPDPEDVVELDEGEGDD
jgi:peptidoglycan hydrolase CwlO-like protein